MRTAFWIENIRQALDTLVSNRLRAALTLLGILIGVAAVIAMVAIGRGVQHYINAQFAAIGTNLIFVIPRAATERGTTGAALQDISSLTMRDVQAIERAVRGRTTAVVPVVQRFGPIESGGREAVTVILGTTPGYAPARDWRPRLAGRQRTREERRRHPRRQLESDQCRAPGPWSPSRSERSRQSADPTSR